LVVTLGRSEAADARARAAGAQVQVQSLVFFEQGGPIDVKELLDW
jgi:hypothetical protein